MTKAKKKRSVVRILAIVLAVLMPMLTTVTAFAEPGTGSGGTVASGPKKYESPDINALTGHGEEPEEISVSTGAKYQEKAWYEYVMYSEHAVASYRISDDQRLLFYDPYTYTNSMIMDVKFDATTTEFDTMSSYTISHTTEKSISVCTESTYTSSESTQTSGRDETHSDVSSKGSVLTNYNYKIDNSESGTKKEETSYEYVPQKDTLHSWTISSVLSETVKVGNEFGFDTTIGTDQSDTYSDSITWLTDKQTNKTEYDGYTTTTTETGTSDTIDMENSTTTGWTQLSARVTKTLGSSISTCHAWSESESTTVSKTYAATHFASDGITPLPWAIVHYTVQMPMKCSLQVKYSGEWITISTVYCLLTTVKGTCRAWMQNGQVYYEDWGNGEPIVATDFWAQFMTKDQLMQAYQDKLYPVGGAE